MNTAVFRRKGGPRVAFFIWPNSHSEVHYGEQAQELTRRLQSLLASLVPR